MRKYILFLLCAGVTRANEPADNTKLGENFDKLEGLLSSAVKSLNAIELPGTTSNSEDKKEEKVAFDRMYYDGEEIWLFREADRHPFLPGPFSRDKRLNLERQLIPGKDKVYGTKNLRETIQFVCGKDSSKFIIDGKELLIDSKDSVTTITMSAGKAKIKTADIVEVEKILLDRRPTKEQQQLLDLSKVDMEGLNDLEVMRAYINNQGNPLSCQAASSIIQGFIATALGLIVISAMYDQATLNSIDLLTSFFDDSSKSTTFRRVVALCIALTIKLCSEIITQALFKPRHIGGMEKANLLPLFYDKLSNMPGAFYDKYPVEKLEAAIQNLKDEKLKRYLVERWDRTASFWVSTIYFFCSISLVPCANYVAPLCLYLLSNVHSAVYEHWSLIVIIGSIVSEIYILKPILDRLLFSMTPIQGAPGGPAPAQAFAIQGVPGGPAPAQALQFEPSAPSSSNPNYLEVKDLQHLLRSVITSSICLMFCWPLFQYHQFMFKEGDARLAELAPTLRMAFADPDKWKDVGTSAPAATEPSIKIESA